MIIKIIIGLLVLSFVVIIHELGHFLFAKKAGIYVEEFCVGLGPRVIYKKIGETIYSIRLFPIGGACMMKGEDEEVEGDCDDSFSSKTVWQRISVVAAGPVFNFILAFIVAFILILSTGVMKPNITDVVENGPAQKAGISKGDKIIEINGASIVTFDDIRLKTFNNGNKEMTIKYESGGVIKETKLNPDMNGSVPVIGIMKNNVKEKVGFFETFSYAGHEVKYWVESVIISLKKLFSGQVSAKAVSGPVGIINVIGTTVEESASGGIGMIMSSIAFFVILISANLGVMNLLPFPALDGGRLVFLLIELITRRKLNKKFEGYVNLAGFVVLMGLMVFLFYNDIVNLIG